MSELSIKLPSKEQLLWPTILMSLALGGGSSGGLLDAWYVYSNDQTTREEERMKDHGLFEAEIKENRRQNTQEWRVFSDKINHLQERLAVLEGHVGVVHPHDHEPLPLTRP